MQSKKLIISTLLVLLFALSLGCADNPTTPELPQPLPETSTLTVPKLLRLRLTQQCICELRNPGTEWDRRVVLLSVKD